MMFYAKLFLIKKHFQNQLNTFSNSKLMPAYYLKDIDLTHLLKFLVFDGKPYSYVVFFFTNDTTMTIQLLSVHLNAIQNHEGNWMDIFFFHFFFHI